MTDQLKNVKDEVAQGAQQTYQFGEHQKEDAKQAAQETGQSAQQPGVETKDTSGSVFQKAGTAVTDTFNKVKGSITGAGK